MSKIGMASLLRFSCQGMFALTIGSPLSVVWEGDESLEEGLKSVVVLRIPSNPAIL